MDPLADVLSAVRMTGGVFLDARFTSPWCVDTRLAVDDCRPFLSHPSQLICYHVVVEGEILAWTEGRDPLPVKAGEVILMPRNDLHRMASAPDVAVINARAVIQPSEHGGLARVSVGGGGGETRMFCGMLGCDEGFNPLIAALPPIIKLDIRESLARGMIESSMAFAARETIGGRPANSSTMARLAELLFIEAVRSYANTEEGCDIGWLRGISDTQIGRAVAALHGDLARAWTVEDLARLVGMSRSSFMSRFTAVIGVSPIRYLTQWRMVAAKRKLSQSSQSIAQTGFDVGYDSEAAFSRAFKRETGVSPAHWRNA